ncbi:MAG: diaminopimelate epimerase, partial [Oscillospiraceae bacterium]|nr:diaminopimelate epimerase [Oscillospiraceae bacterium]
MKYTKMHGAGNGFVLIDNTGSVLSENDCRKLAVSLCREKGTDGLIAICSADDADVGMLFINSDGSVGEMCGNGARCLAKYAVEHGLAPDPDNILIRAEAGIVRAGRISDDVYEIRLNDPSLIDPHRYVRIGDKEYDCFYTELGDPGLPHAVVFTDLDPHEHLNELRETGRALRYAAEFPKGANVSFVLRTGPASARAVTFERGVEDFTLACGTGCGAIACAFAFSDPLINHVEIEMPGGTLEVSLCCESGHIHDIMLTGPAVTLGETDT